MSAVVGVAPAQAALGSKARPAAPVIAAADGTVGIAQSISVVAPALSGQPVMLLFSLNSVTQGQQNLTLDATGRGAFTWVPPATGAWTITGAGSLSVASAVTMTAAPITTRTVLSAVNQAGAGVPTTMTVSVTANAGSYVPAGTVTISNFFGGDYGSVSLAGVTNGRSSGTFVWTPPSPGIYPIVATYVPARGTGGTPNAVASSNLGSRQSVDVLEATPTLALLLPTTFTIDRPVSITAVLNDWRLAGSAAFLGNVSGVVTGLTGSMPVVDSRVTMTWTPTLLGNQSITADFTATNANTSGSSTQAFVVVAPPAPPDPMSVSSAGLGVLRITAVASARGGQTLPLGTASGSGAAVNLSATGACMIVGANLVTSAAGGPCTITATSPGGGVFGPNTAAFPVTVTAA